MLEGEEADNNSVRWKVKTLTDLDTGYVRFDTVLLTTIRDQAGISRRSIDGATSRLAVETSIYEIVCELVAIKRELDGDYHLVLKEINGELGMIAELPNPEEPEVIASGRAPLFRAAKKTIDSLVGAPPFMLEADVVPPKKVRIRGVGFFDAKHLIPQRGMLPNRRELHPVLSILALD
jgi:hypothetical protein